MAKQASPSSAAPLSGRWSGRTVGITGASGALGRALTQALIAEGAWVIAFSHRPRPQAQASPDEAQEWVRWSCGDERQLEPILKGLDVLVLNHGINPGGDQCPDTLSKALEVNAFSHWRLMQQFETIADQDLNREQPRELWVNTSEAEIQPALSPGYELSKRLIGELVSSRWNNRDAEQREALRLRKLILGPFRSNLNPIGVMTSGFVAKQVLWQASLGVNLIIVTPNPLTYLLMPSIELIRRVYCRALKINPPDR
ncbi:SDR family oxidoreductase [Synechococcus sp. WH 8016]|uniref:SDR family oxidoreductase n=1 Tax=Synechococcus sp. WH 8016 TaxID=166318 RepID=UPI00022DA1AC|nr:SDR family oxidoreductase [Synechococcus sp. WH 8016]EHA64363.1 short-chain dehydrogenase/reductase SDR [Synechococcus sp. WH 8016]